MVGRRRYVVAGPGVVRRALGWPFRRPVQAIFVAAVARLIVEKGL